MAWLRAFISLAVTGMLIELGMAANNMVGGPNGGWDTTTDLQTWVASQSFSVGDNLIFQYASNHDVLEVSKPDYDACQTSKPLKTYTGGTTTIPLSSTGKRYFICGTTGHCSQGMKIEIDTLATASPPPASTASPPPASPPSSSVAPPHSSPTISPPSPDAPSSGSPAFPPAPLGSSRPPPPPPSSASQNSFAIGFSFVMMLLAF